MTGAQSSSKMACSQSHPRTFAVLSRMFDCLLIRTLVTPASASTLSRTRQRCGLVVGRPVSFPLTIGVAQLISKRTRLGRRSNASASFCAVFFLSAQVWEQVSEHGYRKMAAFAPIGEQERDRQCEEEARKSEVCRDLSLRRIF